MTPSKDAPDARDLELELVPSQKASPCCGEAVRVARVPDDDEAVRQQVQLFYAERAKAGAPCCGDDPQSKLNYDVDLLTELPDDVSNFSLGCGDPITMAQLQPGETVLDLGSGGGLDCFLAAKQVGEAGKVIGVDMTPEMLVRARQTAQRLNIANVDFREGYLEALPVDDGSVDVVISNCVINLSPDKTKVFAEMFRVLRPGGRVSVSDIVTNGELPEQVKNDMEAWGGCIAGALEKGEYAALLKAAGFVDVAVKPKDADGLQREETPEDVVFSAAITARKPAAL